MEVTAGLAESNGSLLTGLWRDSLRVTCGLTACTPGSAPGPTLGNEYGKTLPLLLLDIAPLCGVHHLRSAQLWHMPTMDQTVTCSPTRSPSTFLSFDEKQSAQLPAFAFQP